MPNSTSNSCAAAAFHDGLLTRYYNIDPQTYNPIDTNKDSIASHQYDRVQQLHNTSSRLTDCSSLLDDAIEILEQQGSSKRSKKEAIKVIKSSVKPTPEIASELTRGAANIVSPIAGSDVATS